MNNKKNISLIIGIILSVVLVFYLYIETDWDTITEILQDLHWEFFIFGAIAYLINIFLRALRFKYLIYSRNIDWTEFIQIAALHNLFMYFLPAKTGDLSYIVLAQKHLNISIPEGTATLLAVRFFDFGIITLLLIFILPITGSKLPAGILNSTIIFIAISSIALFMIVRFLKSPRAHIYIDSESGQFKQKVFLAWNKLIKGLNEIQANNASAQIALLTLGVWSCIYTNSYFIARSLGVEISLIQISIISLIMVPLTLLPLQGFANIGTHELGWVSVLVAFGYPYSTALTIAVGSHFLLMASIVLVACMSYFISHGYLSAQRYIKKDI